MRKLLFTTVAVLAFAGSSQAQENWTRIPTAMPASIIGDWCQYGDSTATNLVGRSEHYEIKPACTSITVDVGGFRWGNYQMGMHCMTTGILAWNKNSDEWSAWRLRSVCSSPRGVGRVYDFEFIRGNLSDDGPRLTITAPPFVPDSVREIR